MAGAEVRLGKVLATLAIAAGMMMYGCGPGDSQRSEAAKQQFKATDPNKKKEEFRNYEADARPSVREFYRLNHRLYARI